MRRLIAAGTVTAVALLGLTAPASAATAPAFPFPTHVTYKVGVMPSASQSSRDAAVEKQYTSWKAAYLVKGCASNEYYVSTKGDDDAPNNGTVSEAQGYGMNIVPLMAGYDANAQTEFNGLWQLVQDHEDGQGMMQWQLDGKTCKYADSGTPDGATDGDLDIGYGLILADKQWGGYTTAALNWLSHFWNADVASDGHLKCEDDGPSTDARPSDFMLDHLRAFAAYDPSHDWNKVVTRTQAVISEFTAAYSPSYGLLSDFVVNANTTSPKPAPADYQEDQPDNIVGYNSIRVPWHMGTDALLYGTSTASVSYATAKLESACLKSESGGNPQNVYPHTNLNCTKRTTDGDGNTDTQAEEAGDAVGPAAMAAGDQTWTDAIWNELAKNPFGDGYYGETIKMIVYIVMAGDYWNPVAGGGTPPPPTGHAFVGGGSGKCIDDNNGSTTNGTQLEIYTCNGGVNQSIVSSGGTLQVLGKCFDANGNGTANNTVVQIWTCSGGANQQWTVNSSNHTIVGVQSGKCLTVQGASTANLAKLILYTCNGKTNQVWTQQ